MKSRASYVEAVSVAMASLRSSKLRSFLTLLGIILATTTLIAVMSVIHGMNRYIAEEVSDMGADGYKVRRMPMMGGAFDWKKYLELMRRNPQMTREEFAFLKERVKLSREFGMEAGRGVAVRYGSDEFDGVGCSGVTANIGVIRNIQTTTGRFITETDDQRRLYVAFIGNDVRERFFPNVDPVGKIIDIQGRPFEVIGAAAPLGTVFGESRDGFVMIPMETYLKIYGDRVGLGFTALALDREHLEQAQDEVRALLRAWRHLGPKDEDNFGMIASDSLVSMWDRLTATIATTATAVVSVFMVVGGVVIMNIMLAVVTERTHEIGIRKSVGARRGDILKQFLVESSMLAATGGAAGVLSAWLVALVVRTYTPVPMAVPPESVVLGVGLSAAVGLFFGIYPARRAARLDPIEALRYEK